MSYRRVSYGQGTTTMQIAGLFSGIGGLERLSGIRKGMVATADSGRRNGPRWSIRSLGVYRQIIRTRPFRWSTM
jgi:hypothetical protein